MGKERGDSPLYKETWRITTARGDQYRHSSMAPISKPIPFLLLTTLLLSLQINARDNKFFSKEKEVLISEGAENKQEQQPVFIPETGTSYGLYGHETYGLHPPTTTTNAAPHTNNNYNGYRQGISNRSCSSVYTVHTIFPSFTHSSMGTISKLIPFLFLTTIFLSLQVNARDSQFFSKVTPLNLKETEVPNNEGAVKKPEQQQPVFIPETENSYGLYGHETGLHPPTTTTTNAAPYTSTTTYKPYTTTTTEEDTAKYSNNNNNYNFKKDGHNSNQNEFRTRLSGTSYNNNNNNYFYNKDAFGKQNELSDTKYTEGAYNSMENQNNNNFYNKDAFGKPNELSDTKYTEGGYNSMENQNNNNKYYYNNNNAANERYFYNNDNDAANNMYYKNNAVNNNYNGERQGLSDTRFMENGRYYYNVDSEKYNQPTLYGDSSRGVNSENWYNNRGYFGNNNVNKNSMEGYQNQEEFEDDQETFEP
ncbi:Protein E6, partial [Mucuna pruriens]